LASFKSHGIAYDAEEGFCSEPTVKVTNNSPNFEYFSLEVRLGPFTFRDLTAVCINRAFPYRLAVHEGWGSFGKVFKVRFCGQELALKNVFLCRGESDKVLSKDTAEKAQRVLKEYCLSKLASAVGAGPTVRGQMGFDLLFYSDCIAYPMEYCQNSNYDCSFAECAEGLRGKLQRLHAIRLLHLDIKDDNICFSRSRGEFVFIDYGLSVLVPETLGAKSFTQFYGTATYCSPEMASLITNQDGGYIDLYYNDVCCLKNVIHRENDE
jgi:hypothetical protein